CCGSAVSATGSATSACTSHTARRSARSSKRCVGFHSSRGGSEHMDQRVFAPQTVTFPATLSVAVFTAAALIALLSSAFFTWRAIASRDPLLLSLALVAAGGCVAFTYEAYAIQTRLVPTISRV